MGCGDDWLSVVFLLFLINNFYINPSSDRQGMKVGGEGSDSWNFYSLLRRTPPNWMQCAELPAQIFKKVIQKSLDITPKPSQINSKKLAFLRNPVDGLKSDMISTEVEKVNSSFPDRLIYGRQKSNFRIVDERKIAKREEHVVLRYSFKSWAPSRSRVGIRELHSIWNNSEALLIS